MMGYRYLWPMVSWQLLCFVRKFGAWDGSHGTMLGICEASRIIADVLSRALLDY
jgi:hypothetical protein